MSDPKFLSNLKILDSIVAFSLPDDAESQKHFKYLLTVFQNLISDPSKEEYRQFVFPSSSFKASQFILDFFENNGFMKCEVDSEIYLMYIEPSIDDLKPIPFFIESNYIKKTSEKEEKAAEIAQKYENRLESKTKKAEIPLKNDKPASMKSINHQYMEARQNAEKDMQEYRNKMKERMPKEEDNKIYAPKIENIPKKEEKLPEQVELQPMNEKVDFVPLEQKTNPKRENVFAFSNRRENEQRLQDTQTQLQEYREEMKKRHVQGGKNPFPKRESDIIVNENYDQILSDCLKEKGLGKKNNKALTMAELEKQRILEDQIKFGVRALALTNQFRKNNNLTPLAWNQMLCDIAMPHSKNMAEGKVPFGHDGFHQRSDSIKTPHELTCENVANSGAYGESLPETIVRSWIDSPGHRKNLLSQTNSCGIAVYRSDDGIWYFTQLISSLSHTDNSCNIF